MENNGQEQPDITQKNELQKEDWESLAREYLEGWKRAKADYINYRREVEDRQKEMAQFAFLGAAMKFFPIVDNFEEAFKHIPADVRDSEWVYGIEQIKKQMENLLKDLGFERIKTVGEKFNTMFHEAVATEDKEGFSSDMIFEEVRAGYILGGKTLIAAKVKVAK